MRNRLVLSGLAATGALETSWLAFSKAFTNDGHIPFCEGNACQAVLSSPFSKLPHLNIPLVNIGAISYATIAVLAVATTLRHENATFKPHALDPYLVFASTSMCAISAYLLAVMILVLNEPCAFCLLSALLSTAMAGVTWTTLDLGDATKEVRIKTTAVLTSLLTAGFVFYSTAAISGADAVASPLKTPASVSATTVDDDQLGSSPPAITQASTTRTLALAERLTKLNAKMYGTYWCSHCFNQKQAFGVQAMQKLTYVECDKAGAHSQYQLCRDKNLPGYPTWEIGGKFYPGEKTIEELEAVVDTSMTRASS